MKTLRFPWLVLVASVALAQGEPDAAPGGAVHGSNAMPAHCRCGLSLEMVAVSQLASAPPVALVAIADADPIQTVLAMYAAFERRDPDGWVAGMSRRYRFESDEPGFAQRHPRGFGRDDELAFASHLFRGGGRAPDGRPLPLVAQVDAPLGAVSVELRSVGAKRAVAHVERLAFRLTFDDGSQVMLEGSDNVLELALEDGEWRVVAWHERVAGGEAPVAADPVADEGREASDDGALPDRLAIRRLGGLAGGTIAFELALPARGGKLELFDVQGRRVAKRDLDGLAPGMRRVELPASGVPAGTYWARVQQSDAVVTTRVIQLH
ncbi:MAG: T9SS type A sorting domain-containing protein [Candidatus Eisenbacteria bacterium]|uniref:T9SS type A sorting domain-containing protein n=1 Tax=Eiseniibacteriota bacterium TaxID=2212470 RepID=A0A933SAT9_UNCEI|nr:T9SS type A sorting domain-containing protein [Candidatus Eisenbacteria bacterium]